MTCSALGCTPSWWPPGGWTALRVRTTTTKTQRRSTSAAWAHPSSRAWRMCRPASSTAACPCTYAVRFSTPTVDRRDRPAPEVSARRPPALPASCRNRWDRFCASSLTCCGSISKTTWTRIFLRIRFSSTTCCVALTFAPPSTENVVRSYTSSSDAPLQLSLMTSKITAANASACPISFLRRR